eukprot:GHVU01083271.1.p1 GENE.GHVU01083271.1~~GHVU01083271.1.p1  ORF type:complete len:291 (-),score=27.13 GHVU01083271.1:344-1216(-)
MYIFRVILYIFIMTRSSKLPRLTIVTNGIVTRYCNKCYNYLPTDDFYRYDSSVADSVGDSFYYTCITCWKRKNANRDRGGADNTTSSTGTGIGTSSSGAVGAEYDDDDELICFVSTSKRGRGDEGERDDGKVKRMKRLMDEATDYVAVKLLSGGAGVHIGATKKSHEQMTETDWRIVRGDFEIGTSISCVVADSSSTESSAGTERTIEVTGGSSTAFGSPSTVSNWLTGSTLHLSGSSSSDDQTDTGSSPTVSSVLTESTSQLTLTCVALRKRRRNRFSESDLFSDSTFL